VLVRPYTGTRVVFERNPYYWKLDPAGQQLPYLDRVAFDVAQDNEVLLLRALNGEFDFHVRHFNTLANKAVVRKYQRRGRYELVERDSTDANVMAIWLNQAHRDPQRRALFGKLDLRIGLSHAIDRAEIIDLVFLGAGTPWQAAPRRGGPYFHERLATQHTAFDRARAELHLDRAGVPRGPDGVRRGPDGAPLAVRVTVRADRPEMVAALQLVQRHWAAVGVRLDLEVVERSLYRQRTLANQHDAAADDVEAGGADLLADADAYAPVGSGSLFGVAWVNWLNQRRADPQAAIEPPADARRAFELHERARETPVPAERQALVREMLDIAADRFWGIGIAAPSDAYGIVALRMRNVPRRQLDSYTLGFPGPLAPEQFFIER
jgi:peptide/nickel transport system substrate-binding protein